jgi:uncharacterized membrane protein
LGNSPFKHSSPLFFTIVYFTLLTLGYTPIILYRTEGRLTPLVGAPGNFFKIGLAMALMAITHFTAIGMIQVAYMISLKRLSLLFAILYGGLWFKEQNLKERLVGGLIIISGAAFIAFA